jgi:glycosyltransferase involved in cell wall biosynthesis
LEYVKGVDILIAALQQIPASTRDKIFVLILGDGSEMQSLKRMVVENSLEQYVRFLGMHQNVIEFLHAADIFILPSRSEGLSNSMLEAISCGLPVMCSALGGALTIVSEKETGFLFEPGNSKDLARCILDSLQYISSWIEMGQNGRDKVQNYASLHKIAVEIVQLYKTS